MTNSLMLLAPFAAMLIAGLSVAAHRLNAAPSIVMLVAGAAIAFSQVTPAFVLSPELVLTVLLPPLLYASGVGMSWRGFRSNLRPILLLSVGCVLFTAAAVAAVAHWVLGLSWPLGFVIGAIVSPPDAVAPMAILRRLGLPRRITTVLEGESLVNDATALVLFGFAVRAIETGGFSAPDALGRFAAVVGSEIAWGLAVGWVMLRLRHWAAEPRAEVLLALATPYLAFLPPHETGASGVIAAVVAGLFVSWNGRKLIRPATRLQGYFIWGLLTWSVEAALFLLTGLQARHVVAALDADGIGPAVEAAALIVAAVVLVRFIWVFPATYLPRMIPAVRAHDPYPNWRVPFLVGFTGLRGAVSLAAALSIPLVAAGQPFPDRDLILFITFAVIAATLLGQGAALPWVVRRLGLDRAGATEAAANRRDERAARIEGVNAVLAAIDKRCKEKGASETIESLLRHHTARHDHLVRSADATIDDDPVSRWSELQLELVDAERGAISQSYEANRLTDEARRRIERELDLEEARVRNGAASGGASDILPLE